MAVKIRLTRTGKKHSLTFRIVAVDSRVKRDGKFIEILGFFNPNRKPAEISIKKDRLEYWLAQGAIPTKAVTKLASLHNGKS